MILQAIYSKIDTDDEGDITIKKVVEHIRAVEAGSGNNHWVNIFCLGLRIKNLIEFLQVNNRLDDLIAEERQNSHVEFDEFLVS